MNTFPITSIFGFVGYSSNKNHFAVAFTFLFGLGAMNYLVDSMVIAMV